MTAPYARNEDNVREKIAKKYSKGVPLKINNPEGHNRHTPKEQLKKAEPEHIYTVEEVKALYQDLRQKYRDYLSATQKHSEAHFQLMGYRSKVEMKEEEN